ncbi:hypothetical protein HanIR_Chr15g0732541 [Helianthus annuus]|nr:hypothetical protein HanIR_Chr15g0732541 [Helianthus annuus]
MVWISGNPSVKTLNPSGWKPLRLVKPKPTSSNSPAHERYLPVRPDLPPCGKPTRPGIEPEYLKT